MSTEIPDFNQGRADIGVDDNLGEEILDDDYVNNEASNIIAEENGELLKTNLELVMEREGDELASETKETLNEIIDDMSPEEMARLKQMNEGQMELSDDTIAKLKVLSEKVAKFIKKYGEKYGAEAFATAIGVVPIAVAIPHGWMAAGATGSASLIMSVFTYTTMKSIERGEYPRLPFEP